MTTRLPDPTQSENYTRYVGVTEINLYVHVNRLLYICLCLDMFRLLPAVFFRSVSCCYDVSSAASSLCYFVFYDLVNGGVVV